MSKRTKKMVEEFKTKLIDKGIDVSEFEEYFKGIESNLKDKKYGLVWENHTEEIETELLTKFPILKEEKELRIHNTEEGLTNNFLIEGDNLESLTALKNMGKKVDVIYIDPPYNTGNRDFVYEDRYVDSEDGYRHSKWLSFMEKRLNLAKDLLTEDGAIYISIDEFEFAQVKILCDYIFGERNFIGNITWDKRNPKGNSKTMTSVSEYILVYGKDKSKISGMYVNKENAVEMVKKAESLFKKVGKVEKPTELRKVVKKYGVGGINVKDFEKEYTLEGANNEFSEWLKTKPTFTQGEKAYKLIDEEGRLYRRVSMAAPKKSNNMTPLIHPDTGKPCPVPRTGWRNKTETMEELLRGGLVDFGQDETTQPNRKYFLTENMKESLRDLISYAGNGIDDLTPMGFSFEIFDNPKPVRLIKRLLEPFNDDVTILDFFAGSGTTGHAVLELNKEDGGNRNFILCTNNENNICRDVTYQRINKVINGYTTPKGKEEEGIPSNLTYLKTELIEKEEDLIDFEVGEEIYESMINNLKVLQNISNTINLKEGRLTKLVGENKNFYLYDNFYIDLDDFEGIELDSNKTNVVYVKEENLTDVVLNKFDEVISLEDLVRF